MSVVNVNNDNFSDVVYSGKLVVLDFYATWCQPCKMIAPIMDSLSQKVSGVVFGKIDTDKCPALASQFKVNSIPTIVFLKDSVPVETVVGYRDEDELMKIIKKHKD